jgi:hypothetical protein
LVSIVPGRGVIKEEGQPFRFECRYTCLVEKSVPACCNVALTCWQKKKQKKKKEKIKLADSLFRV